MQEQHVSRAIALRAPRRCALPIRMIDADALHIAFEKPLARSFARPRAEEFVAAPVPDQNGRARCRPFGFRPSACRRPREACPRSPLAAAFALHVDAYRSPRASRAGAPRCRRPRACAARRRRVERASTCVPVWSSYDEHFVENPRLERRRVHVREHRERRFDVPRAQAVFEGEREVDEAGHAVMLGEYLRSEDREQVGDRARQLRLDILPRVVAAELEPTHVGDRRE